MKKKIFAILLVVSLVAALAVGLAACNKDKDNGNNNTAKASNSETLGTAIAVAMNSSAAGSASAEGDDVDPSFTINGISSIPGIGDALNVATDELAKYLNEYVNNAKAYIKDHNVSVEVKASDKEGYNYLMTVTVTYKDAEGNEKADVSTIYINAKKIKNGEVTDENADIDAKESFAFEAVVMHDEINLVKISGTCEYDKEKDTMVFTFGNGTGLNVSVDGVSTKVVAWANENGGVVVEVNVGVDGTCTVNAKVELGKISNTETGAKVTVDVAVGNRVSVNVVANVVADNAEGSDDFIINGKAVVSAVGVNVNVDITGTANYVEGETADDEGQYVVKINGTVNVKA